MECAHLRAVESLTNTEGVHSAILEEAYSGLLKAMSVFSSVLKITSSSETGLVNLTAKMGSTEELTSV